MLEINGRYIIWYLQVVSMVILVVILAGSVWGITKVTDGLDLTDIVPQNTDEHAFLSAQGKFFGFYNMYAVTQGDFEYPTNQKLLYEYHEAFMRVPNIIKNDDGGLPEFWLSLFRDWLIGKTLWHVSNCLQQCFPIMEEPTSKITSHILRNSTCENSHHASKLNLKWGAKPNKEAVGSIQRPLQCFQLPDKNSCNILRVIWKFSWYFKTFIYLFCSFLWNPKQCFSDLWLGNTDLETFKFTQSVFSLKMIVPVDCTRKIFQFVLHAAQCRSQHVTHTKIIFR